MTLVYEELSGTDFSKVLDTSSSADNNNNYDILINIILKSMNKQMPLVKHLSRFQLVLFAQLNFVIIYINP